MKILAFAGSSSSKSINRALVTYALNFVDTAEIVWIDLNNFEMPIYSVDRQLKDGIPCLAHDLRSMIQNSDAIFARLLSIMVRTVLRLKTFSIGYRA